MVSDPAEIFPSNRVKTARDTAIHAQTATSLYGQNLTGLVQMVNIRDWAKYKSGQVCHQGKGVCMCRVRQRFTQGPQVTTYKKTKEFLFCNPDRVLQGMSDEYGTAFRQYRETTRGL